ncbi:ribosomal protein L7/L12 [Lysinibacillus sp. NPDC094177]|uniref:ribosomal protein L7/L12 n=1 Tax=Lysinibacillus sp. NPDC094177 TaxID=3390580 RepID=UPI003CFFB8F1
MTTQLSLFIITLCAVCIIGVLLSKNKKLNQTKLVTINSENPELISEIRNMVKSNIDNTKIVKHVREKTGLGLVEAKKYIDNIKTKKE